jgi:hypothetical protein
VTKDTTPVCPIDKHDFANCDVFKMTNPVKSITIISETSESVSGKYMNEGPLPWCHQLGEYPLLGDEPRASNTVRFSCVSTKHENQVVVATRAVVRYCLRERGYKIAALNSSKDYVE